jgi:hypothetical protein
MTANIKEIHALVKKLRLKNATVNADGTVDVDSDVDWTDKPFRQFPVQFGEVTGNMHCGNMIALDSFKGMPRKVGKDCHIFNCPNIIFLDGLPEEVGGWFNMPEMPNVRSLEGGPRIVHGMYTCSKSGIISFKGLPKYVGGKFVFFETNIKSADEVARLLTVQIKGEIGGNRKGFSTDMTKKIASILNDGRADGMMDRSLIPTKINELRDVWK